MSSFSGSSHRRFSVKNVVLRNFTKFTGNTCTRDSVPWPATLLKKSLWHSCFPLNSAKFLTTLFLQNYTRRLLLIYKTLNIIYLDKFVLNSSKNSYCQIVIFEVVWKIDNIGQQSFCCIYIKHLVLHNPLRWFQI